ncbi:MAG: alcohol dehydrogenase, partial [Rhodobacterales bacterium 17-64-5]
GLDLGKMIALMAHQRKDLSVWDLEDVDDWYTRADAAKIAPIVAVPTTAGTGSEVGRAGVLTNSVTHKKKIIFHPRLMPVVTICDPALTVGMPRFITAGTGMDALAHCLEAYSSPFYHPMSQGIALEGMRLVFENLPKVYDNPNDLDARAHMMSAAAMGAVAFQKGLGAIHSLSHPVGAVYGTHHGTTNAVVMPMVLDFNRAVIEDRINAAAAYLGFKGFDGFRAAVMALRARLSIPANLTAMGVKAADLDMLTDMALEDPSCGGNPVVMTRENTRALFDACM